MQKIKTMFSLLLFLMFFSSVIYSQNLKVGLTGNIGLSRMDLILGVPTPDFYKCRLVPSGNAGFFIEKKFSKRSSIGGELLWVQMEGMESMVNQPVVTSSGSVIGMVTADQFRHISYIGVPIYYRFAAGNWGIKVGIQSMLKVLQSSNNELYGQIDGEFFHTKGNRDEIKYNNLDYGPKIGLDYELNNRFRLRADFYYGFKSVIPYWIGSRVKSRQLTLGVSYNMNFRK